MDETWARFLTAARGGQPDQVPAAFIVDSPWLPGYAGLDTRDYYLFPETWLAVNKGLLDRFPGAVWIPGFWVEYGMAAEPSAFGARVRFYEDRPPSVEPVVADLGHWAGVKPANPQEDGLMPLVLRLYAAMDERLRAEGLGIRMVAARGPMTVASWLVGTTPLLLGVADSPGLVSTLLDTLTTSIIRWLHAQLAAIRAPEGILLLDDVVGLVSRRSYQALIHRHLCRIFQEFEGLIRIYHNDTPCAHLFGLLAETGLDVLNFSHEIDITDARARLGSRVALMGNVPPLDLGVRGTAGDVLAAARSCLDRGAPGGGMILSFGGGVSPGTPAASVDAMLQAARTWRRGPAPGSDRAPAPGSDRGPAPGSNRGPAAAPAGDGESPPHAG